MIQDRLILGEELGSGYFAKVRFALDKTSNQDIAVKIIDRAKCRGKEDMIAAEIRNWRLLHSVKVSSIGVKL